MCACVWVGGRRGECGMNALSSSHVFYVYFIGCIKHSKNLITKQNNNSVLHLEYKVKKSRRSCKIWILIGLITAVLFSRRVDWEWALES